ncbi:MAG: hypothetical protein A2W26_07280 [Acidobacteria bacterium RBG_16_64_8]|nr:MAG: hypothetical protein A2W26_07280 [Acidobacteria bacterium RBG_16_64_8]
MMPETMMTEREAPETQRRRAVRGRMGKKRKKVLTQAKACTMLKEGQAHGQPLTKKQRGMMAARCEGKPVMKGKSHG